MKKSLHAVAQTIRQLSIEAVQKANSGHPGLPLGCAEIGAYLYGYLLKHNPKKSSWPGRDRFVLSAGHGSMLLYSCLHLSGFDLPIEEIKKFRQLGSKTPGHPEMHLTDGVESTTGPLGQGVANAVGQALGLKILNDKFPGLFGSKVYALAGDGCIMEGISSEASSFAGHLGLNNLVLIYDANKVCLDGPLNECCSEDTKQRYLAYGWQVYEIMDGHDLDQIDAIFTRVKAEQKGPVLVILHTVIGYGSPKAGTSGVHGSPLGPDGVLATKKALGLSNEEFFVSNEVKNYFEGHLAQQAELEQEWNIAFKQLSPEEQALFRAMSSRTPPTESDLTAYPPKDQKALAGRSASSELLQILATKLPYLYGGSADLSCSDLTMLKEFSLIARGNFAERNIKFGVREFAMAAMATGLAQTGMITPFVGTFLTFSDYMRNAIRVAALSQVQVVYQFTHDSIFLGEDGPTHQPVEHYSALRAMPGLQVIRPADSREVKMAWLAALNYAGPTAILLSRQNLPLLPETELSYPEGMGRGAYIVRDSAKKLDYTLFATGSELSLALAVTTELEKRGLAVRVISMPCWMLFEKQDSAYKQQLIHSDIGKRVSIEAGVSHGWHKWIGSDGVAISIDRYGESAKAADLAEHFGFTVESILNRILP